MDHRAIFIIALAALGSPLFVGLSVYLLDRFDAWRHRRSMRPRRLRW